MRYADRTVAGRELATALEYLRGTFPLVLGLPRGGVPVAAEIADELGGELDIVLVRKLGVPWHPELAMGAISEGDGLVVNQDVVDQLRIDRTTFETVRAKERAELAARARSLRGDRSAAAVLDRTVVVVDDGAATGATAAVACRLVRGGKPRRIVAAFPVAPPDTLRRLAAVADEVVCPYAPTDMAGVGGAYVDFHQLSYAEVIQVLEWRPNGKSDA